MIIDHRPRPTGRRHGDLSPSEKLLSKLLNAQLAELERLEPLVRAHAEPDGVHEMRVAVRRLRAGLRTLKQVLDEAWVAHARSELKWIGDRLGAVRDLDVLAQHLRADADQLDGGDAVTATFLLHPFRAERRDANVKLLNALDSERYHNLLAVLREGSTHPPVRRDDVSPERLAAREFRRLRKRGDVSPSLSATALHKRRIRVKRVRYTAELLDEEEDPKVRKFIRDAKFLQDLLGEYHDAIVARRRLRELSRASGRADVGLVAGRLIERQQCRIERTRNDLPAAWNRLRRRGKRTWPT